MKTISADGTHGGDGDGYDGGPLCHEHDDDCDGDSKRHSLQWQVLVLYLITLSLSYYYSIELIHEPVLYCLNSFFYHARAKRELILPLHCSNSTSEYDLGSSRR